MKKLFYKWIFCGLMGWKIAGKMDPEIPKSILMILPHTSWHDFYIGLFVRGIVGLEMHFVAKKELFRFPFGWYFRYMGGAPLDRSGGKNKVDAIVDVFNKRTVFRMGIAPEGTRKPVSELKSGFYFIALKANIPIIPAVFNYGKKTVTLGAAFYPTGNYDADMRMLTENFVGATGKIPQNGFDAKTLR